QVAVLCPVSQGTHSARSSPGRAGFEELDPDSQLGLQPVEDLTTEFRLRRFERRLLLALPRGGERRGAGGSVARRGLAVVAELWVACQCLGPEPRGEGEELAVGGDLGEGQAFGVVRGFLLPPQNGRKPLREGQQGFGLAVQKLSHQQVVPLPNLV